MTKFAKCTSTKCKKRWNCARYMYDGIRKWTLKDFYVKGEKCKEFIDLNERPKK